VSKIKKKNLVAQNTRTIYTILLYYGLFPSTLAQY
jgi:hypothetical protein